MTYSNDDEHKIVSKSRKLAEDEIIFVEDYSCRGLVYYKKDTKRIFHQKEPINIDDKASMKTIYDSPDLVQRVIVKYENYTTSFYLVDEVKYVKKCILENVEPNDVNSASELNVKFEYFVNRGFIGEMPFEVFKDDMLFMYGIGYKLQERGKENELLDEGYQQTICPYTSKFQVTSGASIYKYDGQATVLPNFGSPVYPYTGYNYNISYEYFLYSPSLNEEFIIHIISDNYSAGEKGFDIVMYRSNGEYVLTKRLLVDYAQYYLPSIYVSSNGKYLSLLCDRKPVENPENPDNPVEDKKEEEDKNKKKGDRDYYETTIKQDLKVYELNFVRRKSTVKMIEMYKTKSMMEREEDIDVKKAKKAKEKIIKSEVLLEVKLVRKWEDVGKYFGDYNHPVITDNLTYFYVPYECVRADKDDDGPNVQTVEYAYSYEYRNLKDIKVGDKVKYLKRLLYEDKDVTRNVEGKLGTDENGNQLETTDYEWVGIKNGFIGFRSDRIYYVKMYITKELKNNIIEVNAKFKEIIQIDITLAKLDLVLSRVHECPDPDKILIVLSNNDDNLFLVWGLSENREVKNLSITGTYTIVQGHSSSTGYVLNKYSFINLDNCLSNYFFDYDFDEVTYSLKTDRNIVGKREDTILFNSKFIMKTLYSEVLSLDKFLHGYVEIKEEELSIKDMKFQIEGNTILHLYSLEEDKLKVILDFLENNKKEYLNAILMENYDGKTPLDISIENDSPRTTDLFLRSLSHLDEGNYSQQFYDKFPDLLEMNLKSFHEFLNSCYFQTVQMERTQYLSMRSDEDNILTAHPSCILDRNFFEKHTNEGAAEKAIRKNQLEIVDEEKRINAGKKTLEAEKAKTKAKDDGKGETKVVPVDLTNTMYRQDSHKSEVAEAINEDTHTEENLNKFSKFDESEGDEESSEAKDNSDDYEGGVEGKVEKAKEDAEAHAKQTAEKIGVFSSKDYKTEEGLKKREEELKVMKKDLEKKRKKFENERKNGLARYEIKGIEFDWMFNEEEGKDFMIALGKTDNLEIFDVKVIKYVILYLWKFYRRAIFAKILIPFMLYFTAFIIYSTWINKEKDHENKEGDAYSIGNYALIIVILCFLVFFAYLELRKLIYYKLRYFNSFWNLLDTTSIILNSVAVISDLAGMSVRNRIPILASAALLMWLKLCYFGRMSFKTAWLVRMIFAVTEGMVYFLIVFVLFVLAFANSLLLAARMNDPIFTGNDGFWGAIKYSYRTGLGDFNTDEFPASGSFDNILVY